MKKWLLFICALTMLSSITMVASASSAPPMNLQSLAASHTDCDQELEWLAKAMADAKIADMRRYPSNETSAVVITAVDGCSKTIATVLVDALPAPRYEPCGPNGLDFYTSTSAYVTHTLQGNGRCLAESEKVRSRYCERAETFGWVNLGTHVVGTAYDCPFGQTR